MAESGDLCDACGKGSAGQLLRCASCKQTTYCNQRCQREHWKRGNHKQVCKQLKAAADAEAASSADTNGTCRAPAKVYGFRGGGDDSSKDGKAANPSNPCPICFDNEDDFGECGMCYQCGQL